MKELSKNLPGIELIFNADMSGYTTYKTGGIAEVLALPANAARLAQIISFAKANKTAWRVMGLGSNILVSDSGIAGITCCLKNMRGLQVEGNKITAQAGEPLDNIVAAAVAAGLEGIEGLSGIPGSCGGAVFMNAGAFNQETFDNIFSFTVLEQSGNIKTLKKSDVRPGYRHVGGIENCIILGAAWALKPAADIAALKARRAEVLAKRMEKQPLDYPSAGSVFKRPQNNFASALIDQCGLKGLRAGGAMVSPKHAGFIVNYDKASAADIKKLMDEVRAQVAAKTGVKLELEQILWGDF